MLPGPGEEVDDEIVDDVLNDVEEIRIAVAVLIDKLAAEVPVFATAYAAHEARMKEAADRREYARQLLRLAGDDGEGTA